MNIKIFLDLGIIIHVRINKIILCDFESLFKIILDKKFQNNT